MSSRSSNRIKHLRDETRSTSSSRAGSRIQTPEEEEFTGPLETFTFQNLEDLLNEVLENGNETAGTDKQKEAEKLNEANLQKKLTSINEIIYSLSKSRTEVSSQSRELLLATLYKLVVSKPLIVQNEANYDNSNFVSESKVAELLGHLTKKNFRSSTEFILLFRACMVILASDMDEYGALFTLELQDFLTKLVEDPSTVFINNENKANILTGFASILLVYHNGSSGYGVDKRIDWFLEMSEVYANSADALSQELANGEREYSTFITDEQDDKRIVNDTMSNMKAEIAIATSALHGAACLLTLIDKGSYLNEYIVEIMPRVVVLIENDNIEIAKAAGRLVALCYELYAYDNDDDPSDIDEEYNYNAPYYEQGEIIAILDRLANLSSQKISKKNKKEAHSVFRDVESTLKVYTNRDDRIEILKRSSRGLDLIKSCVDTSYVKLSKGRTISINSWYLYIRWLHLKFLFSFGATIQVAKNPEIRDILREPPSEYQEKYGFSSNLEEGYGDSEVPSNDLHALDEKKRSRTIKKARDEKTAEKLQIS